MQPSHTNINTLSPAATHVVTAASCEPKPFGADRKQALAGGCSR